MFPLTVDNSVASIHVVCMQCVYILNRITVLSSLIECGQLNETYVECSNVMVIMMIAHSQFQHATCALRKLKKKRVHSALLHSRTCLLSVY